MIHKVLWIEESPWGYITELAKIRDDARAKGAWSAATNAEVARGKAGGLYVDQKLIMTGNIDNLSEQELESRMKDILKDHKDIIEGTATDILQEEPETEENIKKLN
jgi:hypothetical protein